MEEALKKIEELIKEEIKDIDGKGYSASAKNWHRGAARGLKVAKDILLPEIELLTADRDYWKDEARKYCAQLGEVRILMGS